jgi:hypothetical protein
LSLLLWMCCYVSFCSCPAHISWLIIFLATNRAGVVGAKRYKECACQVVKVSMLVEVVRTTHDSQFLLGLGITESKASGTCL